MAVAVHAVYSQSYIYIGVVDAVVRWYSCVAREGL